MTEKSSEIKFNERLSDGGDWLSEPYIISLGKNFENLEDNFKNITNDYEGGNGKENSVDFFSMAGDSTKDDRTLAQNMVKRPYHQDTRVGANDAINCLWQFNRDDDIVHPVLVTEGPIGSKQQIGMGRVYASTTQYNQQICWFTFGIPYFTNLGRFYQTAFDQDLIGLNNNAMVSTAEKIGRIFGGAVSLVVTLPCLLFKGPYLMGKFTKKYPVNRFYELRTTMHMYYGYVDSILARWLVDTGLWFNGDFQGGTDGTGYVPAALRCTGASIWDILRRRARVASTSVSRTNSGVRPDMMNVGLDAFYEERDKDLTTIPGMYQHGAGGASGTLTEEKMNKLFEVNDPTNNDNDLNKVQEKSKSSPQQSANGKAAGAYVANENAKTSSSSGGVLAGVGSASDNLDYNNYVNKSTEKTLFSPEPKDWASEFWHSMLGASEFLGFRITNSTDASESFSNSTQESAFARAYNEKVSSAMHVQNDIAGGAQGAVSADQNFLQKGVGMVKNLIGGVLGALKSFDCLGITDLGQALMQGSWIDIPEQYSGSDFNKSHSLSIQLRSPYGDMVSIYQSIIVPLACLLAGTLPRGSGENSYTQPFLCRVYCKGMFAVPMGIIDSLSIKRGDSEFGWNYNQIPLCIDVSLSIKDMSPIMYLALNDSVYGGIFATDSTFNQYLNTLSGMGLFDQISAFSRIKRNLAYTAHRLRNKIFNPAYWSYSISQWNVVQGVAAVLPVTSIPKN
jgi:hypothetical protein